MEELTIVEKALIVVALEAWLEETNTPFLESKKKTIYNKLDLRDNVLDLPINAGKASTITPEPNLIIRKEQGGRYSVELLVDDDVVFPPTDGRKKKQKHKKVKYQNKKPKKAKTVDVDLEKKLYLSRLIKSEIIKHIYFTNKNVTTEDKVHYWVNGASNIVRLLGKPTGELEDRFGSITLIDASERIMNMMLIGWRVLLLNDSEGITIKYQTLGTKFEPYKEDLYQYGDYILKRVGDTHLFTSICIKKSRIYERTK